MQAFEKSYYMPDEGATGDQKTQSAGEYTEKQGMAFCGANSNMLIISSIQEGAWYKIILQRIFS